MQAHGLGWRWTVPMWLAALFGLLILPAGANGATASVSAATFTFNAASNEHNDVTVETDGGVFRVIDNNAPVTAGAGCNQRSLHRVNCDTAGVNLVKVLARDQDDTVLTLIGTTTAQLDGGRGTDSLTSSDGDDTLTAGSGGVGFGGEFLSAGDGDDTVNGPTSNSGGGFLVGGPGDDQLLGGPGFDTFFGDLGADFLQGGGNFDNAFWAETAGITVTVGSGADDGAPGEGDNVRDDVEGIAGTSFADVMIGNSEDQDFSGFGGQDTLQGGGGADSLNGGDNPDDIDGEGGDDRLQGGARADDFSGGPGLDEVSYNDHFGGPVTVTINNVANDGGGSGGGGAEGDNVRTDVENLEGTDFDDTLIGSVQDNRLVGEGGDDNLGGEGGDDDLFGDFEFSGGSSGNDDLGGGDGNDDLFGGGGPDNFGGGPDFDFVDYSEHVFAGTDLTITINNVANDGAAGEGDNVRDTVEGVVGANGNDTITGSSAANTLFGGGGLDDLRGGNGPDLLDGETAGVFSGGFFADIFNGGGGNDTVSYRSHGFQGVTVDIGGGANDGAFGGTEGDDVQDTVENLIGSDANDVLTGTAGPNTITGLNSSDTLNGGEGPDSLAGNGSSDTHNGGGGDDEINSRGDGFIDTDNCGPQDDTAIVDSNDIRNGCEEVFQ